MANIMLSFPGRSDSATLSGGSWETSLPLANLQNRLLSKFARSVNADTSNTTFDVDLATAKNVRTVSLANHNLTLDGTYRIRGSDDPTFATSEVDTGFISAWPALYSTLSLDWESANWWSGQVLQEDIAGFAWNLIHIFDSNVFVRYWRFEFDDTTNGDGYIQMGRLFMAPVFQPAVNMQYGQSISFETKTAIEENPQGVEFFDFRTPYRVARFRLEFMTTDEAMSSVFNMHRQLGIDKEVLYIFDPDDTFHKVNRSFLGRLRELSPIEQPYVELHGASFEIKELL